jgi:hypothetical protein
MKQKCAGPQCLTSAILAIQEEDIRRIMIPRELEHMVCKTLFSFWKEYFLQSICFKVEIGSFFSKVAYSTDLKKRMDLSKVNQLF